MKKAFSLFIILLWLIVMPVTKAHAFTEAELSGNPIDNADHFVWDLMAQMQAPDDPDCTAIAGAALIAGGVSSENVAGPRDGACTALASMRSTMESGMSNGAESTETNLWDATDWHHVENLYFEHSTDGVADGRIAFTVPIDFMSYNFMLFMENFGQSMDSGNGIIGLDADIVNGMAGYGAVLTMYNVNDYESPRILVDGGEDTEGVVSGLVYNRDTHTITFNAAHFSEFEVVEGASTGFSKDTRCHWSKPIETTWINFKPQTKDGVLGTYLTWVQYNANKVDIFIDDGTNSFPWKVSKTSNDGHEFLPNVAGWQKIKFKPYNHCRSGNVGEPVSASMYPNGWYNIF